MGLWDLFKGYAFFKLISLGVGFVFFGIALTVLIIFQQEFSLLLCNIPLLLIGGGALYFALKIWRGEKSSGTSVSAASSFKNGYTREADLKPCPECGEEKMEVELDGSGFCKNCGYSTREYYKEMESEE